MFTGATTADPRALLRVLAGSGRRGSPREGPALRARPLGRSAPGWPGDPDTVEAARAHPERLAGKGLNDIVSHHATLIGGLGALVILLFVFGTLPAIAMPLLVAAASILNTFTVIWLLTYLTGVSVIRTSSGYGSARTTSFESHKRRPVRNTTREMSAGRERISLMATGAPARGRKHDTGHAAHCELDDERKRKEHRRCGSDAPAPQGRQPREDLDAGGYCDRHAGEAKCRVRHISHANRKHVVGPHRH